MTALLLTWVLTAYDPLQVTPAAVRTVDLSVTDPARHRDVPLRLYLPAGQGAAPVLLFSHGLGGSNRGNVFLGEHWARRGYLAVFLQHPGSDETVWKEKPAASRRAALEAAATAEQFVDRAADVRVVLDALERWHQDPASALVGRVDLSRVGMSGHSFGAVTTQAVSGQQFPFGATFTDPRIQAAMALSPSAPRRGSATAAFSKVAVPWLLITGSADVAPIGGQTLAMRRAVFPALPPGHKFELVLEGAEHSAFTDRALPGDALPRNPRHHVVLRAFSTAFFDAFVRKDPEAQRWLEGPDARALLAAGDAWQSR